MQIDVKNEYFKNIAPMISRLQKPETDAVDDEDDDIDNDEDQDDDQDVDQDSDDDLNVWSENVFLEFFRWFHFLCCCRLRQAGSLFCFLLSYFCDESWCMHVLFPSEK